MGVIVDPSYYNQGVQTGIAQQNANLGALKGYYDYTQGKNKDQDFKQLYSQSQQSGAEPSWSDIEQIYAKHGDIEGAERARTKAFDQKAKKFGARSEVYLKQVDAAFDLGDNDAITAVQANMNNDPLITEFIGKVRFQPNNGVSYVLQSDQPVQMQGGKTIQGKKGYQIEAVRGEDGEYYATNMEPTAESQLYSKAQVEVANPDIKDPKATNALRDDMMRLITGTNDLNEKINPQAIESAKKASDAFSSYNLAQNALEADLAEGYNSPKTIAVWRDTVEDAFAKRIQKEYIPAYQETKMWKEVGGKGAPLATHIKAMMAVNELPESKFKEIYYLATKGL